MDYEMNLTENENYNILCPMTSCIFNEPAVLLKNKKVPPIEKKFLED